MRNYLKRRVFVREVDRVVVELSVGVGHVGQQKEQARLVGVGVSCGSDRRLTRRFIHRTILAFTMDLPAPIRPSTLNGRTFSDPGRFLEAK